MDIDSARGLKAELLDFSSRTIRRDPSSLDGSISGLGRATQAGPRQSLPNDAEPATPPVAIGIAPSRDAQGAKVVLIGTHESHRTHPVVERAVRMGGKETVFVVAGSPEPFSHWQPTHRRPLELGISVGHHGHAPGTLGAFVTMKDGAHCLLSANHVLAGLNAGLQGDTIIQPGRDDGDVPGEPVGALRNFIPLKHEPDRNTVDCALADLLEGATPTATFATNEGDEPFRLSGLGMSDELFEGDQVIKFGRTTGRTSGRVFAIEVDNFRVNMGSRTQPKYYTFDNQMQFYSDDCLFAAPGDSGALVMDSSGRAHGLIFAGTVHGGPRGTGLVTANMLEVALRALDARLWLG